LGHHATVSLRRQGALYAGTGRADITPPVPFPMGGWSNQRHEMSRANHRDLAATALCLADDTDPLFLLLTLDLCVLTTPQVDEIRSVVGVATGLEPARVAVSLSHSHASPVTNELTGLWQREGRELVAGYVAMVTSACATAGEEAVRRRQPVRVGTAVGWCDLATNRRCVTADGTLRVGFNPDGPTVRSVSTIRFDTFDGEPLAVLWSYAAHPIILSGDSDVVSPEYPGVARHVLESAFAGARSLFLQGASGDATTREALTADVDVCERAGHEVGYVAAAAATRASTRASIPVARETQEAGHWLSGHDFLPSSPDSTEFAVYQSTVALPLRDDFGDPTQLWSAAWQAEAHLAEVKSTESDPVAIRRAVVETKRQFMLAEQAAALSGLREYAVPLVLLRFNDSVVVMTDVEMFANTALDMMAGSPFRITMVAGHTNGYRNYLPPDPERALGGYEVAFSPFAETAEPRLVAAVVDALRELAGAAEAAGDTGVQR
jgi:neutral ceramidase